MDAKQAAPKRILIVDDSPEDIATYKRYLQKAPEKEVELFEADSGEEGLRVAKEVEPACILLDYMLPDIDGLDFLSQLSRQKTTTAVIMLTGQGSEKVAVQALKDGAYDYILKKEITPTFLQVSVSNALERVNLVEQIGKKQAELQRRNKELQEFATVVSHDLKEPLRKIINFTELLTEKMDDRLDEELKRYFDYITDGAQRMQCMITDLLTYSRMGSRELPFEQVDIQETLEEVLSDLSPAIEQNDIHIEVAPMPTVKGNPTLIRQLFQNLISNAIKYRSEEPPVITISAKKKHERWLFAVKDNGIGMDPQFKERIFKIFQRLHTREEYSGTGVGLAICSKIIEIHEGKIWVESELDKGSVFYFTLPKKNTRIERDT